MKIKHPSQHGMTSLAAAGVAALALLMAGCSSSGGGSGANPRPNSGNTDTPVNPAPSASSETTPTAKVTEGAGNTVVATGNAISDIGKTIQEAPLPLLPTTARESAGDVVIKAGKAVGSLGAGVRDGLGQMGSVDNPVGVTVASTGNVVHDVGEALISGGDLVSGLGTEKLAPLAPVTTPVGGLVRHVGIAVHDGSYKLKSVLSEGPVAQVTNSVSKVIVPLTSKGTDGTQTLGAATHLGEPANGLLYKVGNTVAAGGSMISNTHAPVVSPLGGVVTEAGKTVAAAGALLNGNGQGGGNPLGGLLGNLPLAKAGSNGEGGSAGGALGPVTALLAPVTGLVGGLKQGAHDSQGGSGDHKALQLPLVGGLLR
ncbi:Hemagglutinin transmembrane protein [Cupriavidus necator]|uniref:Hemagglutinin n=1 Tax=Cupriavidus necator (strain ATCC 17699 / DSM 428 / KCTC 22496 / NCIMB 10442 / H16 / Stanier 337) TaxID=381666 RepID=Q0K4U3_CUPNH|nr:collagen-like triple helix repeat-containing protein [Cupriavidus necator]KUE85449.1 hemagglutinin [Cupriavidus necator]QCC02919.1 hemagglutinin [Cupriavidus necator H16]QQB79974.1 collagen-like triple helix repeat-containing protein [Cupriavidus necator]WKA44227.1 collagen-like triple helix repeat-containing protein [Cupriavidus necator]CAJ94981.1 hemagglutinin transmembrane protein [Cupriavidus necator H16]